jgi:SnoaL-like polyketide cyclase.
MTNNRGLTLREITELSNVEKVLFFFDNVWSAPHNVDLIDLLMIEDFQITTAGKLIQGRESFKKWVTEFLERAEDSNLESLDVIEGTCGTKVVVRWKLTGINNGILGLPADKQRFEMFGTAIWLIKDGKLAHNWVERNSFEVYNNLLK